MFLKGAIFSHHPLVGSESLFQSPAADIAPGRKIFVARCKECVLAKGQAQFAIAAVPTARSLLRALARRRFDRNVARGAYDSRASVGAGPPAYDRFQNQKELLRKHVRSLVDDCLFVLLRLATFKFNHLSESTAC
jgi:hypothetical protein